jgi:uncharacterized membrane protein (DUF485 family)
MELGDRLWSWLGAPGTVGDRAAARWNLRVAQPVAGIVATLAAGGSIACAALSYWLASLVLLVFFFGGLLLIREARRAMARLDLGDLEGARKIAWPSGLVGVVLAAVLPGIPMLNAARHLDLLRARGPGAARAPDPSAEGPASLPRAEDLLPPATPPPRISSTCPRCGKPSVWVPRQQRYYCSGERTYV